MKPSINKKLGPSIEKEIINELLKELKSVNSTDNLNKFFSKFFTDYEKHLIFRRIAAMKLISQNKKYREIREILDISANTISKARDILEGRRYSIDPNRKRIYSSTAKYKKPKVYKSNYMGGKNIVNLLPRSRT